MQAMLWATANVTTMTEDPLAQLTKTMTVMQLVTVVTTTVQAGGLTHVWQLTLMDTITEGATAEWLMVSTGAHGTSWQMDGLESVTHLGE